MSLLIVGAIAVGIAMMANNNDDSPVLWGIVTFVLGVIGALVFGMIGSLVGSLLGAGLYVGKTMKFG